MRVPRRNTPKRIARMKLTLEEVAAEVGLPLEEVEEGLGALEAGGFLTRRRVRMRDRAGGCRLGWAITLTMPAEDEES